MHARCVIATPSTYMRRALQRVLRKINFHAVRCLQSHAIDWCANNGPQMLDTVYREERQYFLGKKHIFDDTKT